MLLSPRNYLNTLLPESKCSTSASTFLFIQNIFENRLLHFEKILNVCDRFGGCKSA